MRLDTWLPARGPVRAFAAVNLLNTIGSGLYIAGSALFFTRGLGLPTQTVAAGLGAGLTAGLIVSLVVGRAADRRSPVAIYSGLLGVQALAMLAFPLASSTIAFLVIAVISGIADRSIAGVVGAVIHHLTDASHRTLVRAQLRTTTNLGIAVGSGVAAIGLAVDTAAAYSVLIWGNALTFAVAAVMVARMHLRPATPTGGTRAASAASKGTARSRHEPMRDLRYLAATAAGGVLALQGPLLTFCLPIWIATRTDLPIWMVSAVLLVNTAMVVALQAPVATMVDGFAAARRAARVAGGALGGCCLLLPATRADNGWIAMASLLAWVLVLTVGELATSTVQFFVSFELAPPEAQGAYQSVFALGQGIARAAGPSALALVVLDGGNLGCAALAAALLAAGLALALTARSASSRAGETELRFAA